MEHANDHDRQQEPKLVSKPQVATGAAVPESLSPILQFQQLVGNRAVQQFFKTAEIPHARSANIADNPQGVPNVIMRKADGHSPSGVCPCSREAEPCEECQENQIQRKATENCSATTGFNAAMSKESFGHALATGIRSKMEAGFGQKFDHVKIHTDAAAAEATQAVNALAFTFGNQIYFGPGQFQPDLLTGQRLLAHELTHVMQQGRESTVLSASSGLRGNPKIDDSGEANAEEVSENVVSGRSPGPIIAGIKPSLQRQEFFGTVEELGKVGEVGRSSPKVPPIPIGEPPPGDIARPIAPADGVSSPTQLPTQPVPEMGPPPSQPGTGSSPWARPAPGPVPFAGPMPSPGEDPNRKRDPQCGTKELPLTQVTFFPGPLGQGFRVKASPLTLCPGNTRGSQPNNAIYKDQFNCINKAGDFGYWRRCHLLHGETSTSGPFNLHGPGNTPLNLIIGDQAINGAMSRDAELPAIARVYGGKQVLWYETKVDGYEPGNEFFARSVSVSYGLYDTGSNTEVQPPIFSGPFPRKRNPPLCPPTPIAGSVAPSVQGVTPAVAPDFKPSSPSDTFVLESTLKICLKELAQKDPFRVKSKGVKVQIEANWVDSEGKPLDKTACPIDHYFVVLQQHGMLFGFNDYDRTKRVPVGQPFLLQWVELPDDTYRVRIYIEGDHPSCCLQGTLSVSTFDGSTELRA
jgi:Domain of unknown function (DUF4157)